MYYKLNEHLGLRGYDGLPFGITELSAAETKFYNREQYELILRFDGETELDPETLTENQKKLFDEMTEKKMIEASEEKSPLNEDQLYVSYPAMYKKHVQWSVTGACNYRCKHCFMSSPDCKYANPSREECLDIVDQLAECGVNSVSLTGGEPMVSPWFYDILDRCLEKNLKITTIYSNGALVNKELIREIEKRGMHPNFQLSYDGVGWHDWLRGIDGAEETVLRAFRLLKEHGFRTNAAMSIHKHNLETVNESLRILDTLGVTHLKMNVITPSGLWEKETAHFIEDEVAYQYMIDVAIPRYLKDDLKIGCQFCAVLDINQENKRMTIPVCKFEGYDGALDGYACGSIKNDMYISPEGYVLPCMTMVGSELQKLFPSLRETPLREILTKSGYKEMVMAKGQNVVDRHEECGTCKYRHHCGGGCRACKNNCDSGDFYGLDKHSCAFFRNGWFEKSEALIHELKDDWEKRMSGQSKN